MAFAVDACHAGATAGHDTSGRDATGRSLALQAIVTTDHAQCKGLRTAHQCATEAPAAATLPPGAPQTHRGQQGGRQAAAEAPERLPPPERRRGVPVRHRLRQLIEWMLHALPLLSLPCGAATLHPAPERGPGGRWILSPTCQRPISRRSAGW